MTIEQLAILIIILFPGTAMGFIAMIIIYTEFIEPSIEKKIIIDALIEHRKMDAHKPWGRLLLPTPRNE